MKNRRDAIMFGVTLAVTSQIFYVIPFFKNKDSMAILPFLFFYSVSIAGYFWLPFWSVIFKAAETE